MAQRIFDIYNEKDYTDLWDILPDSIIRIVKDLTDDGGPFNRYYAKDYCYGGTSFININWHDKTEITRPIQEATEVDVEKICAFWDIDIEHPNYGLFLFKTKDGLYVGKDMSFRYKHCRRLTKTEIEELC